MNKLNYFRNFNEYLGCLWFFFLQRWSVGLYDNYIYVSKNKSESCAFFHEDLMSCFKYRSVRVEMGRSGT